MFTGSKMGLSFNLYLLVSNIASTTALGTVASCVTYKVRLPKPFSLISRQLEFAFFWKPQTELWRKVWRWWRCVDISPGRGGEKERFFFLNFRLKLKFAKKIIIKKDSPGNKLAQNKFCFKDSLLSREIGKNCAKVLFFFLWVQVYFIGSVIYFPCTNSSLLYFLQIGTFLHWSCFSISNISMIFYFYLLILLILQQQHNTTHNTQTHGYFMISLETYIFLHNF